MQKNYIMHYAMIGLSAISISLSGMKPTENTIQITPAIIALFSREHQPHQSVNTKQPKIDFLVPSGIENETIVELVELLDQCLLINADGLEKYNIRPYINSLEESIKKKTPEDLIQLFNAIDILQITHKELMLLPLTQNCFLNKITEEHYTNRKRIIDQLNNPRQQTLASYLIKNTVDKNKKNLSEILFDLFIQFKKNSKNEKSSLNKLIQITTPTALQNHLKLTLEQVLLINDILKENSPIKSMVDLSIPNLIGIIILEDYIQKDKQKLALLPPQEKNEAEEPELQEQEQNIAQEKEYNSYRAQFARIKNRCKQFLITYKRRLAITFIMIAYFSLCGYIIAYFSLVGYMYSNQLKTALSSLFWFKITQNN